MRIHVRFDRIPNKNKVCIIILSSMLHRLCSSSSDSSQANRKSHGQKFQKAVIGGTSDDNCLVSSLAIHQQNHKSGISQSISEQPGPSKAGAILCSELQRGAVVCQSKYVLEDRVSLIYPGTKQHLFCGYEQVRLPMHTM